MEVNFDKEHDTAWLTQNEMAILFGVDRTRIVRHIANIYRDGELDELSTSAENAQVRLEGNREIKRTVKIYNLDMIISVGYRVNSKKGIIFRKWASNILKNYLVEGYVVNNKRLSDSALVAITILIAESKPEEKEIIIDLIMNFLTM